MVYDKKEIERLKKLISEAELTSEQQTNKENVQTVGSMDKVSKLIKELDALVASSGIPVKDMESPPLSYDEMKKYADKIFTEIDAAKKDVEAEEAEQNQNQEQAQTK